MRVYLLTSTFPFGTAEQFLEAETHYWSLRKDVELTIIPTRCPASMRDLPDNVQVDTSMAWHPRTIRRHIPQALADTFTKPVAAEIASRLYAPWHLVPLGKSILKYSHFRQNLKKLVAKIPPDSVLYTYWFNEATYALSSMKQRKNFILVSRAHGDDVYEEANPFCYLPMRTRFLSGIDKIYTITQSAEKYMSDRYGIAPNILETHPLGVENHDITVQPSPSGHLHILSCSYLVEVKRIDKIIQAIAMLGEKLVDLKIQWTHIGGGSLDKFARQFATKSFENLSNVSFHFTGPLPNKNVLSFYRNNPVDIFVNLSDSEGVPVTIMEALSCGVPVIAPEIGGIPDLLTHQHNGLLLRKNFSIDDVVKAMSDITLFKSPEIRKNAKLRYLRNYAASVNYPAFIDTVLELARSFH